MPAGRRGPGQLTVFTMNSASAADLIVASRAVGPPDSCGGVADGVTSGIVETLDAVGVGVVSSSRDTEGVVVGVVSTSNDNVGVAVGVTSISIDTVGVGVGLSSMTSGTVPIAASIVFEGVMLCVIETLGVGVGV